MVILLGLHSGALRFAPSPRHAENLPGPDLHDPRVDRHCGLGLFAEAQRDVLVLALVLGDGPDNDRVHAEQAAELGGRGDIRSRVLLEILLVEDAVELAALHDGIGAVLRERGQEHDGDAFADVHVRPIEAGHVAVHRAIVEVEHRHSPAGGRGGWAGSGRGGGGGGALGVQRGRGQGGEAES